jgi:hypothetical protein
MDGWIEMGGNEGCGGWVNEWKAVQAITWFMSDVM